ncbi:MAG TPA: hypothetical protein VN956_27300 [Pyrinomonadaceae bacterium]|nr:hypothetical protein [Pyrinomonadaceae bacterium]
MNQHPSDQDTNHNECSGQLTLLIVNQLAHQYGIYREATRTFGKYAAASITVLALLLLGLVGAARSDPRFYVLILVTIVWYGAILTLFISQSSVTAEYTELLEMKLNSVIGGLSVFEFETKYTYPRNGEVMENLTYGFSLLIGGFVPAAIGIASGAYGLIKGFGFRYLSAFWIVGMCFGLLVAESCAVIYIRKLRGRDNLKRMDDWKKEILSIAKSEAGVGANRAHTISAANAPQGRDVKYAEKLKKMTLKKITLPLE